MNVNDYCLSCNVLDKCDGCLFAIDANGYARLSGVARGVYKRSWMVWNQYNPNKPMPSDGFVIHHRNGIRSDDRIQNLEYVSASDHIRNHVLGDIDRARKVSIALKGKHITDDTRKKLSDRQITDHWRMNQSTAAKKRIERDGHPHQGKKRSEESKQRMSEAWDRKKAEGLMIGQNHPLTKRLDPKLENGPWLFEQYCIMGSTRLAAMLGCSAPTVLKRLRRFGHEIHNGCNQMTYARHDAK
jgi:hypothetical protein